jgi:hypothetical protein
MPTKKGNTNLKSWFNNTFKNKYILYGLLVLLIVGGLVTIFNIQRNNQRTAQAASCTWTGAGADSNFSTPDNWTGCGGGVPADGDNITFPEIASEYEPFNDNIGLSLNSVTVAALNTSFYELSGYNLYVSGVITSSAGTNDFIYNTNIFACETAGTGNFTINLNYTYNNGCSSTFSGNINGQGTYENSGGATYYKGQTINAKMLTSGNSAFYADFSGGTLTFNNTVDITQDSFIWALGANINVPLNTIQVNDGGGLFQRPGNITTQGIDFNGTTTRYGAWATGLTTVTSSNLDLTDVTADISFFGSFVGETRTLIETTSPFQITGEFTNLPTGGTTFIPNFGSVIEVEATYNLDSVTLEVISISAGCEWTGAVNGQMSNAGNWSGCGVGVPSGDYNLIFPASASNKNIVNDITNLQVSKMTVEGGGYNISGNNFTVFGESQFNNIFVDGDTDTYFTLDTQVTTCGVTGSGNFFIESGYEFLAGCGTQYTFSGYIGGAGTFKKYNQTNAVSQIFSGVTTGNDVTIENDSNWLQFNGTNTINGYLINNGGGILFNGGGQLTVTTHAYVQRGEGSQFYPDAGNADEFYGYDLQSGNMGFDFDGLANYGKINITNGETNLSNGSLSLRFFSNYAVGQTYEIITTSGGGSLTGEFSNLSSEGTILAEVWAGGNVVGSAEVSAAYTSTSVELTIINISGAIPGGGAGPSCSGNTVFTTATGSLNSGTSDYGPNSNCKWLIAPLNGDSVTLNFSAFNTENGNDEVLVYDGASTAGTLLGTFSGASLPSSVTADSGSMYIVFTSNPTIEASGFTANWTSTIIPGPTISSINPTSGSVSGGTNITVTGANFTSGQFQDIRSIGSTGLDGIRGMVVDSSGNQYLAGEFTGSITLGSTTLTSSGSQDIYVTKVDTSGNYVWAVNAGGSTTDGFTRRQSMAIDPSDNSLIIGGYFSGSANFGGDTLTGGSGANAFVAKLSQSSGSFSWAVRGGGVTSDLYDSSIFPEQYASSIDVDGSGNIYFSGAFKGTSVDFGGLSLVYQNVQNQKEPYIAKMDTDGNYIWVKSFADSDSPGLAHGLKVDSSGNVYASFNFFNSIVVGSTTLTTNAPFSGSNIATVKLDSNGDPIWAVNSGKSLNTTRHSDLPYDIGLDSNENVYITGYFGAEQATFGGITLTGTSIGSTVYTARLNSSNGTFIWARALAASGFGTARTMHIDSSNRIWIAGGYDNILTDGDKSITGNASNAFFAQYDVNGNLDQLEGIGGTGGQLAVTGVGGNQVRALAVYNNNLYIAGEYFSTIGIGAKTITSEGGQDGFYTTWVSDKASIKVGGNEVIADFSTSNEVTFQTPPGTKGFFDITLTNSNGRSFNFASSFEYTAPAVTNSDISSMVCSPSSTAVNTTVNCEITFSVDQNVLSGSVNVRIGAGGSVINCPVAASGTTLNCNNIPVGNSNGTFASQYNASGSGATYANGNNITVTGATVEITNSEISAMSCSPSTTYVGATVNCAITTTVNLNTLSGSVNVRIGAGGSIVNCPVTGSGFTLNCNFIPVGNTEGTFASQYNASGSGVTYANGNNITVGAAPLCGSGASGTGSNGNTAITDILLCVTAGNLILTSPVSADFTSLTVSDVEQNSAATLTGVTVEDLRGSEAGWSLVCKSSNLTGVTFADTVIPLFSGSASKFNLTPSALQAVGVYGSTQNGLTDYTSQQNTTSLTSTGSNGESNDFNLAAFASGFGVGKFNKNLLLNLTIPPYIRAQSYVGTLTCSVS